MALGRWSSMVWHVYARRQRKGMRSLTRRVCVLPVPLARESRSRVMGGTANLPQICCLSMDMTGAAMAVARQPETGRHYLSDRCPVASDGRGGEKERERSSSSLRTGRNNAICVPFLALNDYRRSTRRKQLRQRTRERSDQIKNTRPPDPRQKNIHLQFDLHGW